MTIPLYIHVPFCRKKCGYCTFYSCSNPSLEEQEFYVEKLIEQIDYFINIRGYNRFKTVYLGGGTPSLLPLRLLERIFEYLSPYTGSWTEEITIESNPEDISPDFLSFLKNSPVDRISLGVQSFHEDVLKASGRFTSEHQIRKAVNLIGDSWSERFNLDIITGLPEQTLKKQKSDILEAVNSGADHISCYSLIVEDSAPVSKNPNLPDADEESEMWEISRNILKTKGYENYEISNFARAGCESLHNLEYWRMNPFLGCGPGAVSMIDEGNPVRLVNPHNFKLWALGEKDNWHWEKESIRPVDFLFENYMMGLRTSEGINRKRFCRRFGNDPEYYISSIMEKNKKEVFISTEQSLSLTEKSRLFMNSLLIKISEELEKRKIDFGLNWP